MKVTVLATCEQEAMQAAVVKKAAVDIEFTALRASQLSPNYAPNVWCVEGFGRESKPVAPTI